MTNTTYFSSDSLVIEGGRSLRGKVRISGSKNASLPALFATILTKERCEIDDVPMLIDIKNACELLGALGAYTRRKGSKVIVEPADLNGYKAPSNIVRRMRASILAMGPLLGRFGKAKVALPGGCSIGLRPIDQHLKFFSRAGAHVLTSQGYVILTIEKRKPVEFEFEVITVTGTENALLYLSTVEGKSVLRNIALEPEVMDLIKVLRKMGANIKLEGRTALIEGHTELRGFRHRVIPDRIEAGTFMVASLVTEGNVVLENVYLEHMESVIKILENIGARIEPLDRRSVKVSKARDFSPVEVSTAEYPGFPTDMQAQVMVPLCLAQGKSLVHENIFENRFQHVRELKKMGARIEVKGRTAFIEGVANLFGAEVLSTDLRASASLVLAGLIAHGTTLVRDIHHLDRGYEKLEEKLRTLGASIERLPVMVS